MAHSGMFVTDDSKASHFVVPTRTALELTWELVLSEETDHFQQTLPDLHVFVQVPILHCGRVPEPQIYWSTSPAGCDTSPIPFETFQICKWAPRPEFATWEKHHYDVAKSIQEECGFDARTDAAAKALGLPLLDACSSKPVIVPGAFFLWPEN
ncbi:hypothetical protein C8R47DRAFT_539987 [Mycena vitilis]|nr:hypothetical protein C8R47DRAFT_539987 [Mycena vitilis]